MTPVSARPAHHIEQRFLEPAILTLNATRMRLHCERDADAHPVQRNRILRETEPSTQRRRTIPATANSQAVMANAGLIDVRRKRPNHHAAFRPFLNRPPIRQLADAGYPKVDAATAQISTRLLRLPVSRSNDAILDVAAAGVAQCSSFPIRGDRTCHFLPDGRPEVAKRRTGIRAQSGEGKSSMYPGALVMEDFLLRYQPLSAGPERCRHNAMVRTGRSDHAFRRSFTRIGSAASSAYVRIQRRNARPGRARQQYLAAVAGFETMALAATRLLVSPDKKRKQRMDVVAPAVSQAAEAVVDSARRGTCGPAAGLAVDVHYFTGDNVITLTYSPE